MKDLILVAMIGYLFGNIQASYLLGKWIKKVDIRTLGQGNAGASNAFETLGMKFGLIVGIIDMVKALVSVLIVKQFFHADLNASSATLLYLNGYCVLLGHIFPFYMHFKGGKGIAALIGMMIGLNPWIGVGALFVIVSVTSITNYVSIGSSALSFYAVVVTLSLRLGWDQRSGNVPDPFPASSELSTDRAQEGNQGFFRFEKKTKDCLAACFR
jgi:glycerol-3-phosphate acyltransferase PlsY